MGVSFAPAHLQPTANIQIENEHLYPCVSGNYLGICLASFWRSYTWSYSGCERTTMQLNCPRGKGLDIIRALYTKPGDNKCKNNPNKDKTVVISICEEKQGCAIPVTNAVFGDPCPGVKKTLSVYWKCKVFPRSQEAIKKKF